jgi:hypothetical protein
LGSCACKHTAEEKKVTGEQDLMKCRRCAVKDAENKEEPHQGVLQEQHKDEVQARMELYKEIRREYDPANELDAESLALLAKYDAWAEEEWAKSESRRPGYTESDEERMIDVETYDII